MAHIHFVIIYLLLSHPFPQISPITITHLQVCCSEKKKKSVNKYLDLNNGS